MDHIGMDRLIRLIFSWEKLRLAIFAEVDFYNSISRTLDDPESMKVASAMWCEPDGWRGWHIKDDGTYHFNDFPEKSFGDIFDTIYNKEELV